MISLAYRSFTFAFSSSIVAVLLIIMISSPTPSPIFLTFTYILNHPQLLSFYLLIWNMIMMCNKYRAEFKISGQDLRRGGHFDIQDLTTAMEWSTPRLTDVTLPPSATCQKCLWRKTRSQKRKVFLPLMEMVGLSWIPGQGKTIGFCPKCTDNHHLLQPPRNCMLCF